MQHAPRRPRRITGFTLMELLVVMTIIGILLGFIMIAAVNATRAAQERATQALISKLDSGLGDRLEALLAQRVNPGQVPDSFAAAGYASTAACNNWSVLPGQAAGNYGAEYKSSFQRAGVLLRYEQMKHEIPDVFVVQTGNSTNYPLNFAFAPYTMNANAGTSADLQSVYPIGVGNPGVPAATPPVLPTVGWGIWGCSYTYLTGIYKNLGKYTDPVSGQQGAGFAPSGYDGVDNNGNTFIDELAESGGDGSIATALGNHKHITARSEALYALLVEGQGPYGSVFNRDDFTGNEVKDTDQDGLPEFVDGWGNPLQFYRWPIFYHSDVQRGLQLVQTGGTDSNGNAIYGLKDAFGNYSTPYSGALDTREQDPLDQNQELIAPNFWSGVGNTTSSTQFTANATVGSSAAVAYFQTYFHQLVEPLMGSGGLGATGGANQRYWDRSIPGSASVITPTGAQSVSLTSRRAFYTRYLILSAGPDGNPGTPYLTDTRAGSAFTEAQVQGFTAATAANWLQLESQAAQATLARSSDGCAMPSLTTNGSDGDHYTNQLQSDGQDDVTNHNLNSSALPVQ